MPAPTLKQTGGAAPLRTRAAGEPERTDTLPEAACGPVWITNPKGTQSQKGTTVCELYLQELDQFVKVNIGETPTHLAEEREKKKSVLKWTGALCFS